MAAHTALGYLLAVGVRGAVRAERLVPALWALVIWVVLLNGGTLAINSVFDKDEGDIGYLIAPPPIPKYLLLFSTTLLVGGLAAGGYYLYESSQNPTSGTVTATWSH